MPLFTPAQYDQLLKNGTHPNVNADHLPVVKLCLDGADCVWLLSELEPDNPHIAFGLCDLGMGCPELGSVDLSEIQSLKLPCDITLQRDRSFIAHYPISVYARAARHLQYVTEDQNILRRYQPASSNQKMRPT